MAREGDDDPASASREKVRVPPIGFWSYSRQDDELSQAKLSGLRALLKAEIQQQYGREPVQLFQDVGAITHGDDWEREIRNALAQATFIIPIITPNFIQSQWCSKEVALFLEREREIFETYPGLRDRGRIFPLLLIDVEDVDPFDAATLEILRARQWFDFRAFRHRRLDDEAVQAAIADFASSIRGLLQTQVPRPLTAEEVRQREEAAAEAVRRREAAEAEARERAAEAQRQRDAELAAAEAARAEAQRQAEEQRRAEATRREEEEEAVRQRRAEAAAARRASGPGPARYAIPIAVLAIMAAIAAYFLLRSAPPATVVSNDSDAQMVAPEAAAPVHAWLFGLWGVDGDCSHWREISGSGSNLTIKFGGGQQVEHIRQASADAATTDIKKYVRKGDHIQASEGEFVSYNLTPCAAAAR